MHDIKYIRNNFSEFKKQVNNRNTEVNLDKILELDTKNRSLIQEKEKLESEKKTLSKQNDKSLFAKSKDLSKKIDKISEDQLNERKKLNQILSQNIEIKGMSHITGGGIPENLPRCMPAHFVPYVDKKSWDIPFLFKFLNLNLSSTTEEDILKLSKPYLLIFCFRKNAVSLSRNNSLFIFFAKE